MNHKLWTSCTQLGRFSIRNLLFLWRNSNSNHNDFSRHSTRNELFLNLFTKGHLACAFFTDSLFQSLSTPFKWDWCHFHNTPLWCRVIKIIAYITQQALQHAFLVHNYIANMWVLSLKVIGYMHYMVSQLLIPLLLW